MKKMTLEFYRDPGHGWIKAPRKLIKDTLQIDDLISRYSYYSKKDDSLYLEEDLDAGILIRTLEHGGIDFELREISVPHQRTHPPYIRNMSRTYNPFWERKKAYEYLKKTN